MKKVLISIAAILIILGAAGFGWYKKAYGGKAYYVKITADGQREISKGDDGSEFPIYEYKQTAYDKAGKAHVVDFTASKNLRKNAYLELTYNQKKGITGWTERQKNEIPASALKQLPE